MPTPLTPDEEFDARFRAGLGHYPEQPDAPAAWHRMERLLDADTQQLGLRRQVLRLLGAEALVVAVGLWAAVHWLPTGQSMAVDRLRAVAAAPPLLSAGPPAPLASPPPAATLPAGAAAPQTTRAATPVPLAAPGPPLAPTGTLVAPGSGRPDYPVPADGPTGATPRHLVPGGPTASLQLAVAPAHRPHYHSSGVRPDGLALAPAQAAASPRRLSDTRQFARWAAASRTATSPVTGLAQRANRHLMPPTGRGSESGSAGVAGGYRSGHFTPTLATEASRQRGAATPAGSAAKAGARLAVPAGRASAGEPIDQLALRHVASGAWLQLPTALAALPIATTTTPDSLPRPQPVLGAYRLRIGLVAAPELSLVRPSHLAAPGGGAGVQLDLRLGQRWHVSTSYLYTVKRYSAYGDDYHVPAANAPHPKWVLNDVDAVCRIVDIPLNLRYDLWQRPRYQVFASAGLSSLLRKLEEYTYAYEPVAGQPVPDYNLALVNGSQHVLQILNLSAGYERAVGPRWTVQAEPYVKLPLGGIGFGNVRLSSAGVFFSLRYGLLPVRSTQAR